MIWIAVPFDLRRRARGVALGVNRGLRAPLSRTIWSFESVAPGAVTTTSSGVAVPTNFSGLSIWIAGPGIRPATSSAAGDQGGQQDQDEEGPDEKSHG